MKTEIGLFDDWAKINIENYCDAIFDGQYYVMRENSRLTKEKKNFLILSLNMGLKSWCASASREGYKLVPVEMHWHKADDLASAEWDKHKALFCSDNRDMTALQVEEFRLRWCKNKAHQIMNEYKAMIEAVEK